VNIVVGNSQTKLRIKIVGIALLSVKKEQELKNIKGFLKDENIQSRKTK